MRLNAHDGHADYFPHSPAQILVACGHNVALVLRDSLHNAVVRVRALVQTRQPLESRVLGDAQRDPIVLSELLQLGHHAVAYVRYALGIHAVHHRLYYVEFVFDRKIYEIRVDEHVIGRAQLRVIIKKQRTRCLRPLAQIQCQFKPQLNNFNKTILTVL